MTTVEQVHGVRAGAGLFRLSSGGLFSVSGSDAERWLGGMVSGDTARLRPGADSSGCYAALLTPKGMIVAVLHILLRGDGSYWVETAPEARDAVLARLDKYIIADDVALTPLDATWARIGLEGPLAGAVLARAVGSVPDIAPDCATEVELAGGPVVVANYGFTGEEALQLFVSSGREDEVAAALLAVGDDVVEAGDEALEILRIEAGFPTFRAELRDEDVLPDEARLERAISLDKGCYTGQEIVARLRSRGRVNHLLVGLRFDGDLPAAGAELHSGERATGEVTSVCVSPSAGPIGLGFVRRADAEPGTRLTAGGSDSTGGATGACVDTLPLVASRTHERPGGS